MNRDEKLKHLKDLEAHPGWELVLEALEVEKVGYAQSILAGISAERYAHDVGVYQGLLFACGKLEEMIEAMEDEGE